MRKGLLIFGVFTSLLCADAVIYENAESGDTAKWSIADNTPSGALIQRVYDEERASNVIELKGKGEENSFLLSNSDKTPWNDESHFILKWKQKSDSSFVIYVKIVTDQGDKYLTFCNCPTDRKVIRGSELSFGLGHDADDGKWHEFEEDLQQRLHSLIPGAKLLKVNGIIVRGSGRFDDIVLSDGNDDTTLLQTPSNFSTSDVTSHSVTLNWEDVEGENSYVILRDGEIIYTTAADVTTYTDTNLTAATSYKYEIKAVNDSSESEPATVEVTTDEEQQPTLPPAPSNFSTSDVTSHSVTLNWEDIDGENSYVILRDGEIVFVTEANVTSYTDNNLTAGTTYTYGIKSVNSAGGSEIVTVEVATDEETTPPADPSNIESVNVTSHSVTIKWQDNSDNESGFEIYRNDLLLFTAAADTTEYTDDNLTAGTDYLYIVKAVNEAGKSEGISLEVTTPSETQTPAAASDLNVTEISQNSITLVWSDNSDNETGFKIIRNKEEIFVTEANVTTYTDTNLTEATTYEYEVKAFNDAGESAPTEMLSVTTKEKVVELSIPANLTATDVSTKSVTLGWEDLSDDESGFKIIRDGNLIFTTDANVTTYTDTNLSAGTTYEYEVIATDGKNDSAPAKVSVTTDDGLAADVEELNAAVDGNNITITWKDVSDNETGFKIIRDGEEIFTTKENITSYTDQNLSENTEYEYTVKAVNEYGESKGVSVKATTAADPVDTYVTYLYHTVLDREPEKEGLGYWTNRLKNGDSAASVAKGFFVITHELEGKNLTNEEYIRKIFITLYQREPFSGELAYWKKILDENALNRGLVFDKLVYTNEFIKLAKSYHLKPFDEDEMLYSRIESLYYLILARKASYGEIKYWADEIKKGDITYEQIVRNFFNSKEFNNRDINDADFIKAAYRAILNREPERAGFEYWQQRLQNGMKKEELINYIFDSAEYKFISSLG